MKKESRKKIDKKIGSQKQWLSNFFVFKQNDSIVLKKNIFTKRWISNLKEEYLMNSESKKNYLFSNKIKKNIIDFSEFEDTTKNLLQIHVLKNMKDFIEGIDFNELVESSIYDKYTHKEIIRNVNNNKLNIFFKSEKEYFIYIRRGDLWHAIDSSDLKSVFLNLNKHRISSSYHSAAKTKLKFDKNGDIELLKNIDLSINGNEINNFEMLKIFLDSSLTDELSVPDVESTLYKNIYEESNFRQKHKDVKTTFNRIETFFNHELVKSRLKIKLLNLNETKGSFILKHSIIEYEYIGDGIYRFWFNDFCTKEKFEKNFTEFNLNLNKLTNTNTKRKVSYWKLILSMLMIALFAYLMYLTFDRIFEPNLLNDTFAGLGNSFDDPWIYILIFNTFLKVNTSFIIALILTKKKSPLLILTRTFRFAVAGELMAMVHIFTGIDYLGIFVWGWYIQKTTDANSPRIVGAIAIGKLYKVIFALLFGIPFMMIGTFNLISLSISAGANNWIYSIVPTAWVGFLWINISSSLLFIFALWKPLNKYFFSLSFGRKIYRTNSYDIYLHKGNEKILEMRGVMSSFNLKSYRGKRNLLSVSLMYSFMLVESFMIVNIMLDMIPNMIGIEEQENYWNFLQITSLQILIKNAGYAIPLPGDLYVSELMISEVYSNLYQNIISVPLNQEQISIISDASSFMTRFWTFYLPQMYKIFFVSIGFVFLLVHDFFKKRTKLYSKI